MIYRWFQIKLISCALQPSSLSGSEKYTRIILYIDIIMLVPLLPIDSHIVDKGSTLSVQFKKVLYYYFENN